MSQADRNDSGPALQPEAADGSSQRLRELFDQHADFVYRVLLHMGVPRAEVEDCVQEVFLVVAHRIAEYQERGAMRAWLFVIARGVALHAQRAQRRRARHQLEIVPPPSSEDPHQQLARKQALKLVNQFLGELDETQAHAFFLAEVEELSMPEIAAALDVKLNTAYSRLRLARRRFERWLAEHLRVAP